MSDLITGWKKVATSGPSVDGRKISAKHLQEMAETYDPAEYTANIYLDHYRFYGNFGQVVALKTGTDKKDRVCLFAKFSPNQRLLELNSQGQYKFFSIEIWEDFAKSGKAYMASLAATDEPASIGTEAMQFSQKIGIKPSLLSQPVEFAMNNQSDEGSTDDQDSDGKDAAGMDADLTLFKRFMSVLRGTDNSLENTPLKDDSNEDDEMNAEQFQQLLEAQQNTNQLLGTLAEKFTAAPAGADGADAGSDAGGDGSDAGGDGADNAAPAVSAEQFQQLVDGQKDLLAKFAVLSGEQPGTDGGDNDGDAGDTQGIVG